MKGIKTELMTHFPLFFGKRKKKSYICSVHFEKSKTKADIITSKNSKRRKNVSDISVFFDVI